RGTRSANGEEGIAVHGMAPVGRHPTALTSCPWPPRRFPDASPRDPRTRGRTRIPAVGADVGVPCEMISEYDRRYSLDGLVSPFPVGATFREGARNRANAATTLGRATDFNHQGHRPCRRNS